MVWWLICCGAFAMTLLFIAWILMDKTPRKPEIP